MNLTKNSSSSAGQTVELVSLTRRFVAYFVDAIIVSVVQSTVWFPLMSVTLAAALEATENTTAKFSPFLHLAYLLSFLIHAGYFTGFWATTGQTPGKMVMGIKVISVDGSPVSWWKAVLRYIGYLINSFLLVGFIWIAFDAKRQGWHDKIAYTYVVPKETFFSSSDAITFVPSSEERRRKGIPSGIRLIALFFLLLFLLPLLAMAILLFLGPVVSP